MFEFESGFFNVLDIMLLLLVLVELVELEDATWSLMTLDDDACFLLVTEHDKLKLLLVLEDDACLSSVPESMSLSLLTSSMSTLSLLPFNFNFDSHILLSFEVSSLAKFVLEGPHGVTVGQLEPASDTRLLSATFPFPLSPAGCVSSIAPKSPKSIFSRSSTSPASTWRVEGAATAEATCWRRES